jgi:hypothetical protein
MGAALTYARRYALFTLVGIAGEDDLDAPDLNLKVEVAPKFEPTPAEGSTQPQSANVAAEQRSYATPTRGRIPTTQIRMAKLATPARILDAEQSKALREQLIEDIARLQTEDEAAEWVYRNLPAKNTLLLADAEIVEADFRDRLAAIESTSAMPEQQLHEASNQSVSTSTETPFLNHEQT